MSRSDVPTSAPLDDLFADAIERAAVSVVSVHARTRLPATGTVWRAENGASGGIVVTASHTVEREEEITVGIGGGTPIPATLLGRDFNTDLAVLQIDETPGSPIDERVAPSRVGNLVFAIYASLILFDILLTVFVLAALLCYITFSKSGGMRLALLAGLFLGLGLLTKGPVVLLHAGWAVVSYPLWRDRQADIAPGRFFAGVGLSLVAMLVVGLAWLVPTIAQMGSDFAYSLVWKQAAGRVTGTLKAAHARPFYFYLLLFPLLFIPWIFSPHLWRSRPLALWREKASEADRSALLLLVPWALGVLLSFSLISGKQPHYLVPILPAVVLVTACFTTKVPPAAIRIGAVLTVAALCIGQGIAWKTAFRRYDLTPLAEFVRQRQDVPWAFSGDYQAQITFLARLTKPLDVIDDAGEAEWSALHPDGYVIERFGKLPEGAELEFSIPVEKGYLSVQSARSLLPKAP